MRIVTPPWDPSQQSLQAHSALRLQVSDLGVGGEAGPCEPRNTRLESFSPRLMGV